LLLFVCDKWLRFFRVYVLPTVPGGPLDLERTRIQPEPLFCWVTPTSNQRTMHCCARTTA